MDNPPGLTLVFDRDKVLGMDDCYFVEFDITELMEIQFQMKYNEEGIDLIDSSTEKKVINVFLSALVPQGRPQKSDIHWSASERTLTLCGVDYIWNTDGENTDENNTDWKVSTVMFWHSSCGLTKPLQLSKSNGDQKQIAKFSKPNSDLTTTKTMWIDVSMLGKTATNIDPDITAAKILITGILAVYYDKIRDAHRTKFNSCPAESAVWIFVHPTT